MSKNFDNTQKKALEKIYGKIFDTSSFADHIPLFEQKLGS